MRWLPLALFALFVACRSAAQVSPLIANIEGRSRTSLNGQWQVIVDPYDVGAVDYHAHALQGNGAFYRTTNLNRSPNWWSTTLILLAACMCRATGIPNATHCCFMKEACGTSGRLTTPKDRRRECSCISAQPITWHTCSNGEELGQHEGGFTPFDFEITDRVRPEGNFLVVRVNNTRGKDYVPTVNTDWWNYGGITRPVTLVEVPETFVQDYSVQLEKGSTRQIKGWLQLNGQQLQQKVSIRIPEVGLNKSFQTDAAGRVEFSFGADLTLWSPENPKLYKVEIASETDHVTDQIGFRSIGVQGTEILLNGKPVFLRGIDIHEEAPMRSGRAWSEDDARILLGWAKELGCNFVRLAHYPHNEAMMRMADQMGVMVWEEVPVYWTIQWENPNTLRNAQNQLSELIARDHNRAAVIIYSVANETPISDERNRFLGQLIHEAQYSDPRGWYLLHFRQKKPRSETT